MKLNWLSVRNFGHVKYFNLSYVVLLGVPLLAEIHTYLHLPFRFPTYFKFLYAASVCYAVAIAVYQYWCPDVIKTYENAHNYVTAWQHIYERAHPDRKLEIVLANLMPTQEELRRRLQEVQDCAGVAESSSSSSTQELNAIIEQVYPSCVQRFLLTTYESAAIRNRLAMWISGVLYVSGTAILVWLLIRRTVLVFNA